MNLDINKNSRTVINDVSTGNEKHIRLPNLLLFVLYPLMFRILDVVRMRIPHIKYNLFMQSDDEEHKMFILKSNDAKSLTGIALELEEPDVKDFIIHSSEIGIVFYCDQIIHLFHRPCPGYKMYFKFQLLDSGYYVPIYGKRFPYDEKMSERDNVELAISISNELLNAYDNERSGVYWF